MYPLKTALPVVDLTQEPEHVIGSLRIQARACVIIAADAEVKIEPRQMQVLIALAQAAPDVVTRADLSARAWGNAVVGDDALNRCITRLRRALLELGQPANIETVPKLGYRLSASLANNENASHLPNYLAPELDQILSDEQTALPVQSADNPTDRPDQVGHPVKVTPAKESRNFLSGGIKRIAVLTGVAMSLAIIWGIWQTRTSSDASLSVAPSAPSESPNTYAIGEVHRVVPGSNRQISQRLSPDGQSLIFVQEVGATLPSTLLLRGLDTDFERELVTKAGIHSPAWSPDGTSIAYVQALPNQSCQLWVLQIRTGAEHKVGNCMHAGYSSVVWSANGNELYFQDKPAPHRPTHIAALNLNTGQVKALTTTQTGSGDIYPTPSSDGTTLAFLREDAWLSGHVYLLDLQQGGLRRLSQSASDIYGLAWEPEERGLLVSSNWGGDIGLWRMGLEQGDVRRIGGAGVNYGFLTSSRTTARLSFEVRQLRSSMVRLQGQGAETTWAPYAHVHQASATTLLPTTDLSSTGIPITAPRDSDPDFDPVHGQLVFVSWRSGRPQLWLHQSTGNPRQLTTNTSDYLGGPRWSPSAQHIVAARAQNAQQDLVLFDIAKGRETLLTQDPALDFAPQWNADGKSVLFVSDRGGALGLWSVDVTSRESKLVMANAQAGAMDTQGNLLFQATNKPGLWLQRTGAGAVQVADLSHRQHAKVRYHQGAYWIMEKRSDDSSALHRYDVESGMQTVGVWRSGLDYKSQFTFARNGEILSTTSVKSAELFWAEPAPASETIAQQVSR
jgi:Tol biopolymer transport system component/DNA-binding winged helix-turn-helix (wHTH) protein